MNYSNMTVEEVINILPAAKEYFEENKINFSINNFRRLSDVIKEHGLQIEEVLNIFKTFQDINTEEKVFIEMDINSLCDYIKRVHHTHLNNLIYQIKSKISIVLDEYASSHPELIHMENLLEVLFTNISAHIEKEENELFKSIKEKSLTSNTIMESLLMQFSLIEQVLHDLRDISFYYFLPCDVDEDFELFYALIQELEENVLSHIHLERNYLFKRMYE